MAIGTEKDVGLVQSNLLLADGYSYISVLDMDIKVNLPLTELKGKRIDPDAQRLHWTTSEGFRQRRSSQIISGLTEMAFAVSKPTYGTYLWILRIHQSLCGLEYGKQVLDQYKYATVDKCHRGPLQPK